MISQQHRVFCQPCLLVCIGNAWTDAGFDNEGAVDFWWTHALISDAVRDSLLNSCNFSGVGPLQQDVLQAASLDRNHKLEVTVICRHLPPSMFPCEVQLLPFVM